jgi:hypothetical protein
MGMASAAEMLGLENSSINRMNLGMAFSICFGLEWFGKFFDSFLFA